MADRTPAARANAVVRRLLGLIQECRAVIPQIGTTADRESAGARAERLLYIALLGAIEVGLVRTMEDTARVLEHASQPLGPMGPEWLERQLKRLGESDIPG